MRMTIESLSKSYGGHDIFADFSLEIEAGSRLAVIGPNGAGKTTLLRLLAGVEEPDSGRVILPKGAQLGYVAQELADADLSMPLTQWAMAELPSWSDFWREWDQATKAGDEAQLTRLATRHAELEEAYGYSPEHRAHAVLSGLGFLEQDHDRPLRELSGGWRERAKLARVLVAGADVLILDEPTNHLDLEAVEWLEQFLHDYDGILIFVAHDRIFLDNVGSHVLFIGGQKPTLRKGTFAAFLKWQEEWEMQREREEQRLQDELDKKLDFVRRFGAKATKARQAGSKKKQAQKLQKELEGYRPERKQKTVAFAWPEPVRAGKTVCSLVEIRFAFDQNRPLWRTPLSQILYRGQKIALAAPNGAGKTTLLKIIQGQLAPDGGHVDLGQNVTMAYFSQHQTEILKPERTVIAEIRRLSDPRTTEEELRSVLGRFLLNEPFFDRYVGDLSGGEKSRLMLSVLFLRRANFLVLDEPTNHLDMETREALIQSLEEFTGTILMVAHDRWLLSRVAEHVWALDTNGIHVHLDGFAGYDKARRAALAATGANPMGSTGTSSPELEDNAPDKPKMDREAQKKLKREQAELRNQLYRAIKPKKQAYEKLEAAFEAMVEKVDEMERTLADPDTYADAERMSVLMQEWGAAKAESETMMEQLEDLEAEIADLEARRSELGD